MKINFITMTLILVFLCFSFVASAAGTYKTYVGTVTNTLSTTSITIGGVKGTDKPTGEKLSTVGLNRQEYPPYGFSNTLYLTYEINQKTLTKKLTMPDGDIVTWKIYGYWYAGTYMSIVFSDFDSFTINAKYPSWELWHWSDMALCVFSVNHPTKKYYSMNMNVSTFLCSSTNFTFVGAYKNIDNTWFPTNYYMWEGLPILIEGKVTIIGTLDPKL